MAWPRASLTRAGGALKAAIPLLGSDIKDVVFVAVTTDPERDTQKVVADYIREAGVFDSCHFLTGPVKAVKQDWTDYGIGVSVGAEDHDFGGSEAGQSQGREEYRKPGLSNDDLNTTGRLIDRFGGGYEVSHRAPYWFIDRSRKLRAAMDADVLPDHIVYNVRVLLDGR